MSSENNHISRFRDKVEGNAVTKEDLFFFQRYCDGKKITEEDKAIALPLLEKAKGLTPISQPRAVINSPASPAARPGQYQNRGYVQQNKPHGPSSQEAHQQAVNSNAAGPEAIGSPFTNPYTFIPFPTKEQAGERHEHTPLTIDEEETDRLTGLIKVELKTLSPLLSQAPASSSAANNAGGQPQRSGDILAIGEDVIVPASSLRGSLRTLLSIISCGPLSCLDENLWLCQGRDTKVDLKAGAVLAKISKVGNSFQAGTVDLGTGTKLIKTSTLKRVFEKNGLDLEKYRPRGNSQTEEIWTDEEGSGLSKHQQPGRFDWRVKLSGRKIGRPEQKKARLDGSPAEEHEGLLNLSASRTITLPKNLWLDYQSRNGSGAVPDLEEGQLVWLVPKSSVTEIQHGEDVASIQWARWGRTGVKFQESLQRLCPWMIPDSIRGDGNVDIVSDLFGMVSLKGDVPFALAARVVPDNLVFKDARRKTVQEYLPALMLPHPGCKAFYMDNDDYDNITLSDLPRGYKVYRTSKESGDTAPWKYKTQPVYRSLHEIKPEQTCEVARQVRLLPSGQTGEFRLSFRALNKRELSLLLLALSCDLRLGGGKPLGLGHCFASKITLVDEYGQKLLEFSPDHAETGKLPDGISSEFLPELLWQQRARLYCLTQKPVEKLRYPSAAQQTRVGTVQRGGHQWFSYFASPKKSNNSEDPAPKGLEVVHTTGVLRQKAQGKSIRAQALPKFNPDNLNSDLLYGYNSFGRKIWEDRVNKYSGFVDADGITEPDAPHGQNQAPNRETRQQGRNRR